MEPHPFVKPTFIKADGTCRYGKYKGVHVTKLPEAYVAWAGENIHGFTARYQFLMSETPEGVEELVRRQLNNVCGNIQSSCGTGRIYNQGLPQPTGKKFVSRIKRPKNWSIEPQPEPTTKNDNGDNPTAPESPV